MRMNKSILFLVLILIKQYNCWVDCADSKCKVPDVASVPGSKVGNSVFRQTQFDKVTTGTKGETTITITKCSAVVQWSEGLYHHQVESACSSLGSEFWFASEYIIEDTITDTYASGQGDATDCYTKDTYYWVGPHNAVKKAKDWDDKGGKIICACDYVQIKDSTGGLATGDTTCYSKDGWGVAYNIECADGCFLCVDEGKCKCKESQAKKKNKCFVCYAAFHDDNDCDWRIGENVIGYPSLYPKDDSYITGFMVCSVFSLLLNIICCFRWCKTKRNETQYHLKVPTHADDEVEEEEEIDPLNV